ncbi:MAG: EamA family transporter RarD [Oscillospiraceae bacterium]|nr:EamA family transporter RarD [Oscillospiraceae bacterium]
MNRTQNNYVFIVVLSYVIWGFLTLFWNLLVEVDSMYILTQRIIWSMVFMAVYMTVTKKWHEIIAVFKDSKSLLICFVSGVLITVNWGVYIYAVNNGHVLDSSLGYFIEPIVVALFGLIFFKERMSKAETFTFVLAAIALFYLIVIHRTFPVIAIVITLSFSAYGAVKKSLKISAHASLFMETLCMTPFALIYAFYMEQNGMGVIGRIDTAAMLLLPVCGIVTSVPLLLFNIGVKEIPLYLIGILNYISPTISFILGLVYFHETLDIHRAVAFILIWIGIFFVITEKLRLLKKNKAQNNDS